MLPDEEMLLLDVGEWRVTAGASVKRQVATFDATAGFGDSRTEYANGAVTIMRVRRDGPTLFWANREVHVDVASRTIVLLSPN